LENKNARARYGILKELDEPLATARSARRNGKRSA
jgi:hypothetical protein